MTLRDAGLVADELLVGLIGRRMVAPRPAAWLDGLATLEAVASWLPPLGRPMEIWTDSDDSEAEHDCA